MWSQRPRKARAAARRAWGVVVTTAVLASIAVSGVACTRGAPAPRPQPQPQTEQTATAAPPPSPTPTKATPEPAPQPLPITLTAGGDGVVTSRLGMVSSVHEEATRAGVAMLEAGGNAVDAAVAVAYALAVTHPSAGNLGGGGFMLIQMNGAAPIAIDFREKAPQALTHKGFAEMIRNRALEPRASGVPGSVAGLNHALSRYGSLARAEVLQPAIDLARRGHALGERQAQVLSWSWPLLQRDPAARALYAQGKRPLAEGQLLVQPKLAVVLERIAAKGDAGFYEGKTASAIASYMKQHGGWLTERDLAEYRAVERRPLHTTYRGLDVHVMPPPSAGGVSVVLMLNMLEQLTQPGDSVDDAAALHLFAEVAKRAHAERRFEVVDPDSVDDYRQHEQRARWADPKLWLGPFPITEQNVTPSKKLHPLYGAAVAELDNTTHFSVADAQGNVVSCTTTLSGGFGAKYVIGELGLVMNNSVAAFGTAGQDVPKPGRRMTSSMSPTIVSFDGRPLLALGSPGGDTIPNTVVQVLRNLVDAKDDLRNAVEKPRIHHGFVPDAIRYERLRPPPKSILAGLQRLGHKLDQPRRTIGDANNIAIIDGSSYGYADRREGGLALAPTRIKADPQRGTP